MGNVSRTIIRIALLASLIAPVASRTLGAQPLSGSAAQPVPAITSVIVTPAAFSPGETITVSFTTSGPFNPNNVFTAQMSNLVGDFTNPRFLGSWPSTSQGAIAAKVPCELGAGTGFRIRVIASAPGVNGPDNGAPLTVNPRPLFEVTADGPTTFCPGGSVRLTASPGYVYYHWNTNDTARSIVATRSAIYTVTAFDSNDCGLVTRATVTVLNPPTPPIRITNGVVLETDFGYVHYQWKLDSMPIPDSDWPTLKINGKGIYTVTVTDTNGCQGTSQPKKVPSSGVEPESAGNSDVRIAIAPAHDRVAIETELSHAARVDVMLSDVSGRELRTIGEMGGGGIYHREIEVGSLPPGVYMVLVKIGERVVTAKIVR
jgi:hypothetical protein